MNEKEKSEEERSMSIALCIGMGALIVLTQIIALTFATPFEVSGIKAFENPESMRNPFYFFILIIGFTALILAVLRFGGKRLVYFVMLAAVAVTIYYVMIALEAPFYKFVEGVSVPIYNIMQVLRPYSTLPLVITFILTLLLYKYPEWYVLDATGLIIGGGAAAIFGISLGIIPVLILMVILAVYDAIAVYKTKHMVSLAESIVDMRIPVLFVLPRTRNFSLLRDKDQDKDKSEMEEAFFMGLGDAIIPTMLVVSANCMFTSTYYLGIINAPALGAVIGTLAGYAVLSRIAGRGKPHAGLPFLNSGAIIGFVIGYIVMVV
ncbi:MAG: presenilin family intramembrane aspartyl protease PSH [Halobacteriota archaeon]